MTVTLLRSLGIFVCKRQVVRLLNTGQDDFLAEAREVLRARLSSAALWRLQAVETEKCTCERPGPGGMNSGWKVTIRRADRDGSRPAVKSSNS
jgi:hypothetical protein